MAYSITEQFSLDINWYFADRFNRLCVAASGGGILPTRIAENDGNNDLFHSTIIELPERFKVARNENIINQIEGLTNQNLDIYFRDFDSLAGRGLFVYDKLRLRTPEDGSYVLVAYPIYDPAVDTYPIDRQNLSLIPKTKRAIINRVNGNLTRSNFVPLNLVNIINSL